MQFKQQFDRYKVLTEAYLQTLSADFFAGLPYYKKLADAMNYSLRAGGKRIRPVMLLAASEMAGGSAEAALPFAAALEMIHTGSLIHDDLPAMDNDDLRRGKPTNHKVFGEATAILAGDALFLYPFELMARNAKTKGAVRAMQIVAESAGMHGMCGGQQIDLSYEGKAADADIIMQLNRLKTGALFEAAICVGISVAGGNEKALQAGKIYGENIGQAFQLVDDLLDNDPQADTGKTKGSDAESQKSTYLSVYGVEKCETLVVDCTRRAVEALTEAFGEKAAFLNALAMQLPSRKQ